MNSKGFTLVELMVAISLAAILALSVWMAFRGSVETHRRFQNRAEITTTLMRFAEELDRDIRASSRVDSLSAASLVLFGDSSFTRWLIDASATQLTIRRTVSDSGIAWSAQPGDLVLELSRPDTNVKAAFLSHDSLSVRYSFSDGQTPVFGREMFRNGN